MLLIHTTGLKGKNLSSQPQENTKVTKEIFTYIYNINRTADKYRDRSKMQIKSKQHKFGLISLRQK